MGELIKHLRDICDELSLDELKEIQNELIFEIDDIAKFIKNKINEKTKRMHKCAYCGTVVDDDAPFELIFGTPGLRKKAYFCGSDCLMSFLQDYQEMKNSKLRKQNYHKTYF